MNMMLQVALFYVTFGGMVTLTLAQTGLCPAQNGDFPNPSSELCTTFFRCLQWLPSLLRCPLNQRFDFLFRFCRPQEAVDCPSQLQVFSAPSLLSDIGGISPGLLSDIGGISPGLLSDIGGISPGLLSDIGGISPGLLSNIGGISPGLLSLSGTRGIGGLGAVSGLGSGLSERGLISLLSQLEGNGNNEENENNQMATLLMMSALMNQMNSVTQQETPAGPLPVSNLYPANSQTSLNSFRGHGGQVTNQHYQQMDDTYSRQPASAGPDNGLSLGTGRAFIFLPQYEPSTSQGHLPQGQGNMASAGPGTDAGDLGQRGVIQGAVQDQDTFKDPGILPGHDNIQGQNRPGGQFSNSSPLARRFPRRRGQGQRRKIQARLADNEPASTEGPGLNVNSTLGSGALSSIA